ncbi:hypothetical protein SAMN05216389_102405 [Oceanobacillus limi]|uniref:YceG-like family protein n=2 Tax=Oceanobacillus limi TaxID=930131 RepID=A0A1H9ZQG3_9BACI|nr:hypothetical protein SAMN05216389_102405 [Oceanobacillus limi]
MKQSIRAFSIGLFSAGLVLLAVYYFDNGSTQDITEMPVDDVIAYMKEEYGYRVLTESEFISLTVNQEANDSESKEEANKESEDTSSAKANEEEETDKDENEKSEEEDHEEKNEEEETITSYTLTIEAGSASSVGDKLAENGIIDNASEFNQYLSDEGYDVKVQLGEFEVQSDMSFNEIAEVITK